MFPDYSKGKLIPNTADSNMDTGMNSDVTNNRKILSNSNLKYTWKRSS